MGKDRRKYSSEKQKVRQSFDSGKKRKKETL